MITAKYQPWYKRVLIPFWFVQLGFMLWLIISASIVTQYSGTGLGNGSVLVLSFCCICLALDVIEIILFSAGKLRPLFYLISQVIKSTLWLVLFVIDVVGLATYAAIDSRSSVTASVAIAVAILTVILLSFVGTLIYAAIIYHRARRGRADRTYASPLYQDASPLHKRDNASSFTRSPAPAYMADTEIGREHAHAAGSGVAETSHSFPSYELDNGNHPSSAIPNSRNI